MRFFVPALLLLATACADPEWPPDEAVAAMNAGLREIERGRARAAIPCFEAAAVGAPTWTEAKVNLAVARFHGQDKRLRAALDDLHETVPYHPHSLFLRGVQLRMEGKPEAALPHLRRLTAAEPEDAHAWCWRGLAAKDADLEREAIRAFRRCLDLSPPTLRPAVTALKVLEGTAEQAKSTEQPIRGQYRHWGPRGRAIRRFPGVDVKLPPGSARLTLQLVPGRPVGTMEGDLGDPSAPQSYGLEVRSGRHHGEWTFEPGLGTCRLELGDLLRVDYLRIRWPSGRLTAHGPYDTNQTITLRESEQ